MKEISEEEFYKLDDLYFKEFGVSIPINYEYQSSMREPYFVELVKDAIRTGDPEIKFQSTSKEGIDY